MQNLNPLTLLISLSLLVLFPTHSQANSLQRLPYNNPGLTVDLGVGLWAFPIPIDFDNDGDLDLVISCPDKPYNGTYFFENPGTPADKHQTPTNKMPVFKPGQRISKGLRNIHLSTVKGVPHILGPAKLYHNFKVAGLDQSIGLPLNPRFHKGKIRGNHWSLVDYDNDGLTDLIIGIGDWTEYGWDDAFNKKGRWTRGPLRGYVYLAKNIGTKRAAKYAKPVKLKAGGTIIDVYGRPCPNFADFDGDGDLDLLCGEFKDTFTYFQNIGTRSKPKYAPGQKLTHNNKTIKMDLEMIVPVAIDWDKDGDIDLIVGDEDGRVAFVEHLGKFDKGIPRFAPPRYFQQQAADIKFGALATPVGFDWDGDGDDDILTGNTAGHIAFIENLGPSVQGAPKWAAPKLLSANNKTIRIMAGYNGSIQGPCEAKWGYTTLNVADWDHDGLPDIIINSIWGKILWYKNTGTRTTPKLAAAQPITVIWEGETPKPAWNWWNPKRGNLVTQWRTTPVITDWNKDGLNDLIILDHEGYLALFTRTKIKGKLALYSGVRIFIDEKGKPLRLNSGRAGRSGRRKLCAVDWDRDGRTDFFINSVNANWLRNVGRKNGKTILKDMGPVDKRRLAGHTSSPATIDLDGDGKPELLVGAEDGYFYYQRPQPSNKPNSQPKNK